MMYADTSDPSFNGQLMRLEEEEASLKNKIQTLEADMEDINRSIGTITEMAYAQEHTGLSSSEIDEVLYLRSTIMAGCEEEIEASRRKLWEIDRIRDDLYGQRNRFSY